MGEKIRLDKMLSNMGIGSRTEMRNALRRGSVTVNGTVVKTGKEKVDVEEDDVYYEGSKVIYKKFVTLMLHKPPGVISATEDSRHQTVLDLLEEPYVNMKLFPVGRLDIDTEGLLILTNDGALSHDVLSPKKHVPKTYEALIDTLVSDEDAVSFKNGVVLDDGYVCKPAELKVIKQNADGTSLVEVILFEGKFHQVKRMFESVGKKVLYLKRVKMGGLALDEQLEIGTYRELTDLEIDLLKER